MKYLTLILLFFACASTQPVVTPPIVTPPKPEDTVYLPGKTVYDTIRMTKTDTVVTIRTDTITQVKVQTVNLYIPDTFYEAIAVDTVVNAIHLAPVAGDNIPQIQAALTYCQTHGIYEIDFAPGYFRTYSQIKLMNFQGGRFGNYTIKLKGACWAKNPVSGFVTEFDPQFTNAPTIIIQQGKDVDISNIMFQGLYDLPDTLTPLDIDTLSFEGWDDHLCTRGPTNPYAAIAFDVFSDSTAFTDKFQMYAGLHQYYVPTGGSGSTSCRVHGCDFENYVVGVAVTIGDNYNGELIDVDDNQFVYDEVPYAYSQAQSKANTFNNNMIWGQTRIAVDGNHFGFQRGDGNTAPFIDGMNVAGYNYEFTECATRSFSGSYRNIYSEGWFRLGITGATNSRGPGVHFTDCQIDFLDDGPSPDFFYQGAGTTFDNCMLRYYNGGTGPRRIVINDVGDRIQDGVMSAPPLVVAAQVNAPQTIVNNVGMFYDYTLGTTLSGNTYDSLAGGLTVYLTIDRSTFNGYYLTPDTANLTPYMLLVAPMIEPVDSMSNYAPIGQVLNSQSIVGIFDHKDGDTVFFSNGNVNLHTGMELAVYKALYK